MGEGSCSCAVEPGSIRIRLLLVTESEGECCSVFMGSFRFLELELEPALVV